MKKMPVFLPRRQKWLTSLAWGISAFLLTLVLSLGVFPTMAQVSGTMGNQEPFGIEPLPELMSLKRQLQTQTMGSGEPSGIEPLPELMSLKRQLQTMSTAQLVQQGNQSYQQGQYTDAITFWQQALETFASPGNQLNQAMILSNLALAYQKLGQWNEAQDAIAQSLSLLQTTPPNNTRDRLPIHAQALTNLGTLQLAQGDAKTALTTWKQATDDYQQIGDQTGVTRSLINQSQALEALALYPRACTTLLQVFEFTDHDCRDIRQLEANTFLETLRQQSQASPLKRQGLNRLGSLLRTLGDLTLSQKILELSLTLQPPTTASATLLDLGNTSRDLSNQARDLYQRSETINTFQHALNTTQTALNYYQTAAESRSDYQQQAQLNRLNLLLDVETWLQERQAQLAQKDPQTLIFANQEKLPQLIEEWLSQIQQQLSDIDIATIQTNFINLPPSYGAVIAQTNLVQTLIHLKKRSPQISWSTLDPLLTIARKNAETINNIRAKSYALGYSGYRYEQTQNWALAKTLTQDALNLAQSIQAWDIAYRWSWQLGRLYQNQGETESAIAAYQNAYNNLQTLRRDLTASAADFQFTFREQVEAPIYRNLVDLLLQLDNPSPATLKQARQVMESLQIAELENFLQAPCTPTNLAEIDRVIEEKDPTAAFLYPIILPQRLEVILKLPGKDNVYSYRQPISETEVRKTLTEFRKNLQYPYLSTETKQQSQLLYNWLIQPIRSRLDAAQIKTLVFVLDGSLRTIPLATLYDGKQFLIENYAIAVAPNLMLQNPQRLSPDQLNVLAASLTEPPPGFEQFAKLPNVNVELTKIEQTGVTLISLRDDQFTRENFNQQLNQSAFKVIHLATHGKFSSNPEDTFLLVADGKLTVKELEDLFRIRNASQTNLIELLVFSACETAEGDERADLGIAGTTVRAGASSAIATLWSVDDQFSVEFMQEFYQQLSQGTVTKAEALRRTQAKFLNDNQYQSPLYWAPYILVGSWI
ncbi:CHAT domain-containing protein [Coleofasciculus sp.]|uniref:CHAT domain-containing protein n=1 Tax=Coleofasciculus sp. TaxID=3100458 RepID=UPI003A164E5E